MREENVNHSGKSFNYRNIDICGFCDDIHGDLGEYGWKRC